VLDSARWYTSAIGARYDRALRDVYHELRSAHGGAIIDYTRFLARLPALFPGGDAEHGIVHDVLADVHARWASVLGIDDWSARSLARASHDLRPAVDEAFRAAAPGWPSARQHSPDVLIAADSVDAIGRGDYRVVLGELHVALNTVALPCLLKEHVDPAVLANAREADLPDPVVKPVWSKAFNRANDFSLSRHDFDLEQSDATSTRPRDHVLALGALVVEEIDDHVYVRTRDGNHRFHVLAFLDTHLTAESYAHFSLLGAHPHVPRITIDQVVVQRECWRFASEVVAFAHEDGELARFLAARRFVEQHGLPRMVFAKTDAERKPFYVDFDSPILVDILARNVKRSRHVALSEMLPTISECWLPDANGDRYTSELRLVAIDQRAWSPHVAP
jgi:hypothetical protein